MATLWQLPVHWAFSAQLVWRLVHCIHHINLLADWKRERVWRVSARWLAMAWKFGAAHSTQLSSTLKPKDAQWFHWAYLLQRQIPHDSINGIQISFCIHHVSTIYICDKVLYILEKCYVYILNVFKYDIIGIYKYMLYVFLSHIPIYDLYI